MKIEKVVKDKVEYILIDNEVYEVNDQSLHYVSNIDLSTYKRETHYIDIEDYIVKSFGPKLRSLIDEPDDYIITGEYLEIRIPKICLTEYPNLKVFLYSRNNSVIYYDVLDNKIKSAEIYRCNVFTFKNIRVGIFEVNSKMKGVEINND